jgi:hypothetical protein
MRPTITPMARDNGAQGWTVTTKSNQMVGTECRGETWKIKT